MGQKISITRALAEIRSIDARFNNALTEHPFIAITRGLGEQRKLHSSAETVETIESRIQGAFDSVEALLKRRNSLKAAVVQANATNTVKIGDEDMTVAAAIERKTSIKLETDFLNTLRSQYVQANSGVTQLRATIDKEIEQALAVVYGNDKGKITEEQHAAASKPKRDANEPGLLDPKSLGNYITALTKKVTTFLTEVDFVLSEFNSRTEIELTD